MSTAENQDQVIIKPLTGAGGAAVWGLDITKMDDAGYGQVNDLMLQYGALAIHGQADASVDDLRSFGLHYGELDIHGYSPTVEGFDDVMTIGQLRGEAFHSDVSWKEVPPNGQLEAKVHCGKLSTKIQWPFTNHQQRVVIINRSKTSVWPLLGGMGWSMDSHVTTRHVTN